MEIICPNVILFGYDTEHMLENYQMKIFVTFMLYIKFYIWCTQLTSSVLR